MNKVTETVGKARGFIGDVGAEMKKCAWPERQELMDSTIVVIVSVLLLSFFVGVSDKLLVMLLKLLTSSG